MGAAWVTGTFIDTDWKRGIANIKSKADFEYGHQDGYSGAENSCTFKYDGDMTGKTVEEVKRFLELKESKLSTGMGGVVRLSLEGYANYVLKTAESPVDTNLLSYITSDKPAAALKIKNGIIVVIKEGTLNDLHDIAKSEIKRLGNKDIKIFLVSKRSKKQISYYLCGTISQNKQTGDNVIDSIPIYKYGYYGWCRE